jgi:hypothetical protein
MPVETLPMRLGELAELAQCGVKVVLGCFGEVLPALVIQAVKANCLGEIQQRHTPGGFR